MKTRLYSRPIAFGTEQWHKLRQKFSNPQTERAMGTLEIVVITGILLTVALIFNSQIRSFASNLFKSVFNDSKVISNILR